MSRDCLFLVLDAIPYDVALEVWRTGAFARFAEPRPLISVFPSLTTCAVPELVAPVSGVRPPGYEARYWHPEHGVQGGVTDPETARSLEAFRTSQGGAPEHMVEYALGHRFAYGEIRWITRRFALEGGPWLGYLSSTDAVTHFEGRAALVAAVTDIAHRLTAVCREHETRTGVAPEVVLCSDHGARFGPLEDVAAEELEVLLRVAGLRDRAHLAPLGTVNGGAVWADADCAVEVAEVVATLRGVELAFARVPGGFVALRVRAGVERAEVFVDGELFRYAPVHGDPLDLGGDLALDAAGWLARTWDHTFPDPVVRVWRGLSDLVRQPATVLFSMEPGKTFGPAMTRVAARAIGGQVGTHGALRREESTGFAMATAPGWTRHGPLRSQEAFAPWADWLRAPSSDA